MSEIPISNIVVSGADSLAFLQAQLTTDIACLSGEHAGRSAWCNAKGRVICMPFVSVTDDGYLLTMPSDLAVTVVPRLTMFRFRSNVEFVLQPAAARSAQARLEMLRAGVAEIELAQSEQFTPHMLNLDLLGIVSLDKGCYPGQEIVARTHYRGASKRRCLRFESAAPVAAGDKVSDGERDVGEVVNAIGNDLLAVVSLDHANRDLFIGDVSLSRAELPYATGP
jgi:folate-binding protein YgfZ